MAPVKNGKAIFNSIPKGMVAAVESFAYTKLLRGSVELRIYTQLHNEVLIY